MVDATASLAAARDIDDVLYSVEQIVVDERFVASLDLGHMIWRLTGPGTVGRQV